MMSDKVRQVKTNFVSLVVIGVLIFALSLIGSSFPGLPLILEVQRDIVFVQASNDASSTISETGKISSSQQASQSQSNKQLSETDERNLLDTVTKNGFFEANSVYPPSTANQEDYILHVLAISVNGKTHTVLWTDSSSNVPAGISSIAQRIENMASNK